MKYWHATELLLRPQLCDPLPVSPPCNHPHSRFLSFLEYRAVQNWATCLVDRQMAQAAPGTRRATAQCPHPPHDPSGRLRTWLVALNPMQAKKSLAPIDVEIDEGRVDHKYVKRASAVMQRPSIRPGTSFCSRRRSHALFTDIFAKHTNDDHRRYQFQVYVRSCQRRVAKPPYHTCVTPYTPGDVTLKAMCRCSDFNKQ